MSQDVNQVASALGALPELTPEMQKELDRLAQAPYFDLPKVKSCHSFLEECRLGNACARVVGDSGVGKTMTAKAYAKRLKGISTPGDAVYVLLPPNCTSKGVYEEILKSLGFTYTKGSISVLRNRTRQTLTSRKVAVLLFDEANHLKRDALGEMQYLEEAEVVKSIILIGTDRLDALICQNEEVKRRYPRYQYGRVSTNELRELVDLWEAMVIRLPMASNLTSKKHFVLIESTTGRCIGKMDELLRRAARKALILGEAKISYERLKEIAAQF